MFQILCPLTRRIKCFTRSEASITDLLGRRWQCWAGLYVSRPTIRTVTSSFADNVGGYANDDLFRYTRMRFVQNEVEEMTARYVRFNVVELARTAARAVGANACVGLEKLADGVHNKALLLTMEDGRQVVAKIPYPVAGASHLTTASEVATMHLMRERLNIPVPKVFAWCSHASKSQVGAEYIIMSKAPGVSLKSVWGTMSLRDRFAVVKEIAKFQTAWSSASYAGYGSIYYTQDISPEQRLPLECQPVSQPNSQFSIGPTTGRDWLDDGRHAVAFDRGPWESLQAYLEATGRREMECVSKPAHLPPTQVTLAGPGTYESTREKKLRALQYYLEIVPHLLPATKAFSKPSAWHGDLHLENIFVDCDEPTGITCLLDWQSTEIAPLFVQARQPYILDHSGPPAIGLDRPQLPDNFEILTPIEKQAANDILLDQSLCVAYRRWIQTHHTELWKCFEFQDTPELELLLYARALLVDGEAIYAAHVAEHLTTGGILDGSGLDISQATRAEIKADVEGALRGMKAMTEMKEVMGDLFPERGCVRNDQYDDTKYALRQMKRQIIQAFAKTDADRAAWENSWPFDD